MIDQNGLKIHEEVMKCSFLENSEAFSLQLFRSEKLRPQKTS